MKVKSETEVAQSCLTLSDPMDCSLPGFSIHGIFQARVMEWGAIAFSITYIWSLKKNDTNELIYLQNRNRPTDIENKLMVTKGERGEGDK